MKKAILLLCLALISISYAKAIIVVNKKSPMADLPKPALKAMFSGDLKTWKDGKGVTVILSANQKVHEEFLAAYMEKNAAKFNDTWNKLVFTGKGVMPQTLKNDQDVISFVSENEGAIGYIDSESLNDKIKALIIK